MFLPVPAAQGHLAVTVTPGAVSQPLQDLIQNAGGLQLTGKPLAVTLGSIRLLCTLRCVCHERTSCFITYRTNTDCTSKASMSSSSCFPFSSKVPIWPFSIFTSPHSIWFLALVASSFFFSSSWFFWRVLCCSASFCSDVKENESYNLSPSLRCCGEQKESHITW